MSTTFTPPEEGAKKEFKTCPEGTHIARLISWIDIGTHPYEYQGETKTPRKVRLTWETPNETAVFDEEKGEQPFLVSTELTMSFHKKSNLFKLLAGWIGMTEENKGEFNPEKELLGKECLVNIQHEESKKGNTFAKVASVTPLLKGTECPKQISDSQYFFMGWNGHASEFDEDVFKMLPAFIQEKIEKSPEYMDAHAYSKSVDAAEEVFKKKEKTATE